MSSKILLGPGPIIPQSAVALGEWLVSAWSSQASFPLGSGFFQRDLREEVAGKKRPHHQLEQD